MAGVRVRRRREVAVVRMRVGECIFGSERERERGREEVCCAGFGLGLEVDGEMGKLCGKELFNRGLRI